MAGVESTPGHAGSAGLAQARTLLLVGAVLLGLPLMHGRPSTNPRPTPASSAATAIPAFARVATGLTTSMARTAPPLSDVLTISDAWRAVPHRSWLRCDADGCSGHGGLMSMADSAIPGRCWQGGDCWQA